MKNFEWLNDEYDLENVVSIHSPDDMDVILQFKRLRECEYLDNEPDDLDEWGKI